MPYQSLIPTAFTHCTDISNLQIQRSPFTGRYCKVIKIAWAGDSSSPHEMSRAQLALTLGGRSYALLPTWVAALQHFQVTHLQFFQDQASARTVSYRCQWCLAQCKHFVRNMMKLHSQLCLNYQNTSLPRHAGTHLYCTAMTTTLTFTI